MPVARVTSCCNRLRQSVAVKVDHDQCLRCAEFTQTFALVKTREDAVRGDSHRPGVAPLGRRSRLHRVPQDHRAETCGDQSTTVRSCTPIAGARSPCGVIRSADLRIPPGGEARGLRVSQSARRKAIRSARSAAVTRSRTAAVVELHHIFERRRRAVVEVRRAGGQGAERRDLNLPTSSHRPVTRARPGSVVRSTQPALRAAQRVGRACRGSVTRRRSAEAHEHAARVAAGIGRVVTRAAGTRRAGGTHDG